jgi:hypothetical protein
MELLLNTYLNMPGVNKSTDVTRHAPKYKTDILKPEIACGMCMYIYTYIYIYTYLIL